MLSYGWGTYYMAGEHVDVCAMIGITVHLGYQQSGNQHLGKRSGAIFNLQKPANILHLPSQNQSKCRRSSDKR